MASVPTQSAVNWSRVPSRTMLVPRENSEKVCNPTSRQFEYALAPRYPLADLGVQRFLFLGRKSAIIRDRSDRSVELRRRRRIRETKEVELVPVDISVAAPEHLVSSFGTPAGRSRWYCSTRAGGVHGSTANWIAARDCSSTDAGSPV